MIKKEIELKNLLIEKDKIEVKIEKRTNKLILSQKISFSKKPNYEDVLVALQFFLNSNSFRWIDLEFSFLFYSHKPVGHIHFKIKMFLFGKRKSILKKIREIAGRIVAMHEWTGEEVAISSLSGCNIKRFLIP